MIKLNRVTEYGLIALRHMTTKQHQPAEVTSAREIAEHYGFPFEMTAKTLQRLKDGGLIRSAQGSKGGYRLHRELAAVSLVDFLELMEGPQSLVNCLLPSPASALPSNVLGDGLSPAFVGVPAGSPGKLSDGPVTAKDCAYEPHCELKQVMGQLNRRIVQFLAQIPLTELTERVEGGDGGRSAWETRATAQAVGPQPPPEARVKI